MKRKTVLFILIAALLAFAVHAADTGNVRLDELGMSIDVPADCSVFTRNMSPDDPALAEYGIDLEQMNQLMAERSIYLDLVRSVDHERGPSCCICPFNGSVNTTSLRGDCATAFQCWRTPAPKNARPRLNACAQKASAPMRAAGLRRRPLCRNP